MQIPKPYFDNLNILIDPDYTINSLAHLPSNQTFVADLHKSLEFLLSYRGSNATFNSYRREIDKFLQWCWLIQQKSVRELKRQDIEAYIAFYQKPPSAWIGLKNVARFILGPDESRIANPEWRPFVVSVSKRAFKLGEKPNKNSYQLSQTGLREIFAILSSFYNFLIQDGYTEINPILQIRQKSKFIRKTNTKKPIRRLSELEWQFVLDTANELAKQNPEQHERTLFIMSALYSMYLRISELVVSRRWQPKMCDFFRDQDGLWWFLTVGKGNKERQVSVSNAMLKALERYRKFLNLTPLPNPSDESPLLPKTRGQGGISDTRYIRRIVQNCFDTAIQNMHAKGLANEAINLEEATVHWLRHTGISDDVKSRPREHVRDDAGHSSSLITDRYIDVTLRERHASKEKQDI